MIFEALVTRGGWETIRIQADSKEEAYERWINGEYTVIIESKNDYLGPDDLERNEEVEKYFHG